MKFNIFIFYFLISCLSLLIHSLSSSTSPSPLTEEKLDKLFSYFGDKLEKNKHLFLDVQNGMFSALTFSSNNIPEKDSACPNYLFFKYRQSIDLALSKLNSYLMQGAIFVSTSEEMTKSLISLCKSNKKKIIKLTKAKLEQTKRQIKTKMNDLLSLYSLNAHKYHTYLQTENEIAQSEIEIIQLYDDLKHYDKFDCSKNFYITQSMNQFLSFYRRSDILVEIFQQFIKCLKGENKTSEIVNVLFDESDNSDFNDVPALILSLYMKNIKFKILGNEMLKKYLVSFRPGHYLQTARMIIKDLKKFKKNKKALSLWTKRPSVFNFLRFIAFYIGKALGNVVKERIIYRVRFLKQYYKKSKKEMIIIDNS